MEIGDFVMPDAGEPVCVIGILSAVTKPPVQFFHYTGITQNGRHVEVFYDGAGTIAPAFEVDPVVIQGFAYWASRYLSDHWEQPAFAHGALGDRLVGYCDALMETLEILSPKYPHFTVNRPQAITDALLYWSGRSIVPHRLHYDRDPNTAMARVRIAETEHDSLLLELSNIPQMARIDQCFK